MIVLRRVNGGYLVRVHPQVPPVFLSSREGAINAVERLYWVIS